MKARRWVVALAFSSVAALACADQPSGDVELGRQKSALCAGCHGDDGKGVPPNPPLVGLTESYFIEQMQAYQLGTRTDPMMKPFADTLSDQDFADLAAYYASLE